MATVTVNGVVQTEDGSTLESLISSATSEVGANTVEHAMRGFRLITDGGTHTTNEVYHTIQIIAEAVVTITNGAGGDNLTSVTLPAGTVLYGVFTDISVTSGTIIAYILGTV